jgi:hypothetical protein
LSGGGGIFLMRISSFEGASGTDAQAYVNSKKTIIGKKWNNLFFIGQIFSFLFLNRGF